MTQMIETWINDRWPLLLPEHRAVRPEWPWWEAARLASMYHELVMTDETRSWNDDANNQFYVSPTGPREVIYDIGAEEGDLPALWSSWGCDVVLFEPNDRVWPNIKAIWEANDLRPPLASISGFAGPENRFLTEGHAVGIAAEEQEWPISAYGEIIGDHGFCNLSERPDIMSVMIDTVAELTKPPTAITIDVEGAEHEVLMGAQRVLAEHKPKVWVSIHREFAQRMYDHPDVLEAIQDLMSSHGYPDDGRGEHLATDHEEHWVWLP